MNIVAAYPLIFTKSGDFLEQVNANFTKEHTLPYNYSVKECMTFVGTKVRDESKRHRNSKEVCSIPSCSQVC
jgi:hypothetical protein